jgi:hypothetical protein
MAAKQKGLNKGNVERVIMFLASITGPLVKLINELIRVL